MPRRKYPVHEQELLALVNFLRAHRSYLISRAFIAFTDHKSLIYLQTQPFLSKRQAGWVEQLQEFNFKIEYLPGQFNVVADVLSRNPTYAPRCIECTKRLVMTALHDQLPPPFPASITAEEWSNATLEDEYANVIRQEIALAGPEQHGRFRRFSGHPDARRRTLLRGIKTLRPLRTSVNHPRAKSRPIAGRRTRRSRRHIRQVAPTFLLADHAQRYPLIHPHVPPMPRLRVKRQARVYERVAHSWGSKHDSRIRSVLSPRRKRSPRCTTGPLRRRLPFHTGSPNPLLVHGHKSRVSVPVHEPRMEAHRHATDIHLRPRSKGPVRFLRSLLHALRHASRVRHCTPSTN